MMLNGWLKNTMNMETNFNFKSAICTSREQSEKLLALCLKPETADCGIYYSELAGCDRMFAKIETEFEADEIPAWSLHRLIEMVAHTQYPYYVISKELPIYDALCERIEWLIKDGYFNKEYLVC